METRMSPNHDVTRRRRQCDQCGFRFTTHEKIEMAMPYVVKKDGRREPFSIEKILSGLRKACQKRPITTEQLEKTASEIERKIAGLNVKEVPSQLVGHELMQALSQLDQVAYVRFASVYREFRDVDQFLAEIHKLQPKQPKKKSNPASES
jgi:transcriptional repressor NrdR